MTSSRPPFDADAAQLKDFLFAEGSRLHVPDYQREFSWTKEQLESFWIELVGPKATSGKFAGTILLLDGGKGSVEIVDGQQRVTVATILLAAVRDIAQRNGDIEFAKQIQRSDIQTLNQDTFELEEFRLVPSLSCRQYFIDTIQEFPTKNIDPDTNEQKRVAKAYEYFVSQINLAFKDDLLPGLRRCRTNIRELRVVKIKVYEDSLKFEIFESVNARGLSLSAADLVKNHIISHTSPNKVHSVNEQWMESAARAEECGIAFTDVIRYYWNGRYAFVTKRSLFEKIKSNCTNKAEATNVLEEILLSVETIEILRKGSAEDIRDGFSGPKKHSMSFVKSATLLNVLGVKLHLVIFLILHRYRDQLPPGKIARFADLVARFSLAHVGLCQGPVNRIERFLAKTGREIVDALTEPNEKKRTKRVNQAFDSAEKEFVSNRWPRNEDIDAAVLDLRYEPTHQTKGLIRALFACLEMSRDAGGEVALDWASINIEHIQPQNPIDTSESDLYVDHVHRLGNLVLIAERTNKKMGNMRPADKAESLCDSALLVTREAGALLQSCQWSPEEVEVRTHNLIKEFSSILHKPQK